MKRVLITGATGFIGRWAVQPLLDRGYEVHGTGSRPAEIDVADYHAMDLFDPQAVETLIARLRPTHLLHFAWIATPGVYWTTPDNFRWASASLALLKRFHGAGGKRAVMAGTCAEYDWTQAGVCHEFNTPLATDGGRTATPYATAKINLQKKLDSFGRKKNISTAWGRIFFQYGPHEHPGRLVASVINALMDGREAVCTPGRQVRGFLHTTDVGDAFAALLDSDVQGPVNIGDDTPVTVAELVQTIGEIMQRQDLIGLGQRPAPEGEPPLLLPDLHRLHDEVGWRAKRSLREGLESVIRWWAQKASA